MRDQSKLDACWFWQPSVRLSQAVILVLGLACWAVLLADLALLFKLSMLGLLSIQMTWQCYRWYSAQQPYLRCGVRYTAHGWQLWSPQQGWRSVQLRADSMALPALVLLRYKYAGQWFYRSAVIPADSLPQDNHRRLRVRLKFSRQRWRAV